MVREVCLSLIVVASLMLMLWRPKGIREAWWVCGGVVMLLVARLLPWSDAGKAIAKGTDVYLFLTGMMLLSELAREHGVFDWVASLAVGHAKGSGSRLFLLVYGAGVVVTALLSNDATAVVMTPAVLAATKKSGDGGDVDPVPHLFACAMVANAASFLLPISNPANLVVFAKNMPPLGRWIAMFALPSVASIAVTFAVLRWWFRRELAKPIGDAKQTEALKPAGRWVLAGLGCVSAVLLFASALKMDLGAPTCVSAVVLVLAVSVAGEGSFGKKLSCLAGGVSWSVLPLVAGLFCLVEAVSRAGLAALAAQTLQHVQQWPRAAGVMGLGMGLGVLNNLVNNLPLGLIAGQAVQEAKIHGALANAVLLGVDLGPNLSVTGSLATILWLMKIREQGLKVSGGAFLRLGLVAMPLALVAALGTLLLLR